MNLGRMLTGTAERYPDDPAVTWGDVHLTYAQLDERVNRLASAFSGLGLEKGDRVAFILWNRPELLETIFACFKLGLCAVPLNARFNAEEIVYHAGDARVRALVYGPELADEIATAEARLETAEHLISVGDAHVDATGAKTHGYEELLSTGRVTEAAVDVPSDHLVWLFYTSGTTGRPKGAMLTHSNLWFVTLSWVCDLMPLSPDEVTLHTAPLTHGAGFHALAAISKGAHNVIPDTSRSDAGDILQLIESAGVTNTWMVPTQIVRLIDTPSLPDHDLSKLHTIVYGGAPFHVEALKEAVAKLGPILVQIYGQGETPMTGTYLPRREHVLGDPEAAERLESAGCARTGIEVRIVDDGDREVPRGEMGEVVVRGQSVMQGYWERPEESQKTLRGGWLHTGDVGRMDERGYLYVLERMKDMIITGGANVYAREVEEVLHRHPDVRSAAVIGVADRVWGERVIAVVVRESHPEGGEAELIEHCGRFLASYKKPKQVDFVEELPVSPYGKVLKRELRQRYSTNGT